MALLSLPETCLVLAGVTSWIWLNRHDVRGDYALSFFAASFLGLYLGVHANSGSNPREDLNYSARLAATYFGSLVLSTVAYRLSPWHPLAGFPGPLLWRTSSLFLSAVSFRGYRHIQLDELHKKHGRFVRIGPNHLSVHSPGAAAALYSASDMEKSESYNPPGRTPGVSLFFKHTKEEHTLRKRIWSSGFTTNAYVQYCYPMDRRVWQLVQCLQDRSTETGYVDIAEALAHWSYDFMGEMVFGGSNDLELMRDGDAENLVDGGKKAMVIVDSIGQSPWLLDILWHLPASKDIHQLRHAAERMMKKRIATKTVDIQDVSSYLLAGDPSTGDFIPENELAIDAVVGIQAGSDNTATLLGLAFYFLLANRPTYLKLRSAIDAKFANPKDTLDLDVLSEIPYLNGVINETLRLMTPFFLPRIVPREGTTIDGVHIPGGSIVALASYTQQTCEENFGPDSLDFRPERWLEDEDEHMNRAAMVPFSQGRFVCVAKTFAMHELRFVLTRLMLNFDMDLKPGFDVDGFRKRIRNMRTTLFSEPLLVSAKLREGATKSNI